MTTTPPPPETTMWSASELGRALIGVGYGLRMLSSQQAMSFAQDAVTDWQQESWLEIAAQLELREAAR